jgi:hypothetical protein
MSATRTAPWPSAKELKQADVRVAAAGHCLDKLSFSFSDQYSAYMESGEAKPSPLTVEEYGRLVLYLESMELSLGSAMRSIESMKANLDEVLWEAVDLEKAGIDA